MKKLLITLMALSTLIMTGCLGFGEGQEEDSGVDQGSETRVLRELPVADQGSDIFANNSLRAEIGRGENSGGKSIVNDSELGKTPQYAKEKVYLSFRVVGGPAMISYADQGHGVGYDGKYQKTTYYNLPVDDSEQSPLPNDYVDTTSEEGYIQNLGITETRRREGYIETVLY